MSLSAILDNLDALLRLDADEGVRTVDCDPNVVRALGLPPDAPAPARAAPPPPAPGAPQAAGTAAPYQRFGSTPELDAVAREVVACTRCGLCRGRRQTVPGQGNPAPELAFVGEGPGEDEDRQGLAFVGRSGQLLTRLIEAMGLRREEVWIGNIVKCRPPDNRQPTPAEMTACLPYLRTQLALLKPRVIVALGGTAVKGLLDTPTGITRLRGQWQRFADIDLMPTYHPSYLLRAGGEERARYWEVWEDMAEVLRRLGRPVPDRQRRGDRGA